MEEKEFTIRCNHCNNVTILQLIGSYVFSTYEETFYRQFPPKIHHSLDPFNNGKIDVTTQKTALLLKCSVCGQPTFAHRTQWFENGQERFFLDQEDDPFLDMDFAMSIDWENIGASQITTIHPPLDESPLVPQPNIDMPLEIIDDYNEAKMIFPNSPRASAALLRLTIQKLCQHFGLPGENIEEEIESLGLSEEISQNLAKVHIIGNNSVRPGEFDIRDNAETASSLFKIINLIVTEKITEPREINDIYSSFPETVLKEIAERPFKGKKPTKKQTKQSNN